MIILTGKPGAGKDTQATLLAAQTGFSVLNVGQLLRERAVHDPQLKNILQAGRLVDDQTLFALMSEALLSHSAEKIIMINCPRDIAQAEWLTQYLSQHGTQLTDVVVCNIVISDDIARQRVRARQRSDDTELAFTKRLEIYSHQATQAQRYLSRHGAQVLDVDGSGTPPEVQSRLIRALQNAKII